MFLPCLPCCDGGGVAYPCDPFCSCDIAVTVEEQEVLRDDYAGPNPFPECEYFEGVFRICVVDNTDAASLAAGFDKVLVTAVYTFEFGGPSGVEWIVILLRLVQGFKTSDCTVATGATKLDYFSLPCSEDGCPQGDSPVLYDTVYSETDPAPPQSWLDNPCFASAPVITLDCNPFP